MASGNSSFLSSDYTAYAINQVLTKNWIQQHTAACALYAKIKDAGSQFHKGNHINKNSLKLMVPIMFVGPTHGAAGVADASELTADSGLTDTTVGFSQAAYNITHYRYSMNLRDSENKLAGNGAYGNILQGKIDQMSTSFRELMATDIEGTAADSRTALMGVEYAVATGNVVGGIDQAAASSATLYWRGNRTAVGGALTLTPIDSMYTTIRLKADGLGAAYTPDLILAGYSSTISVYDRFYSLLSGAERVVNQEFNGKFGFSSFSYRGMDVVASQRITSGTMQMLTTKSWYYDGDMMPVLASQPGGVIPGTDARYWTYNMWGCLAVDAPRVNGILTGITG